MSKLRLLANQLANTLRDRWATLRDWLSTDTGGRVLLILILVVAAYLRWSHLNWDQGTHIHPDERFLTMVESALQLPKSLGEFFDSTRSPMSPYNTGHDFFVYGTLPIFIVRVFAEFFQKFNEAAKLWTVAPNVPLTMTGYDGVHLVGRWLSGLADLAGVWLIYVIGQRLYSRKVGLVAALLLAFAPLALQQSHFFTVDTFGTLFALLTLYFAVRVAQGGEQGANGKWQDAHSDTQSASDIPQSAIPLRGTHAVRNPHSKGDGGWLTYVALGASLGASIACRINLAPLAGIALLAAGIRAWDDWHTPTLVPSPSRGRAGEGVWLGTLLQATLFRLLLMGIVAIAVFRMAQPYAFSGTSLLDFNLAPKWLSNMRYVSQLISGDADSPPGHQWTNRTPFVFPLVNMIVWGMGLPMGLAAWAGWLVALLQVIRGLTRRGDGNGFRAHLLPVVWIGGMFLWQGLQYVQSMRYLLPIYPMLAMMAAWVLWHAVEKAGSWKLETGNWKLEARSSKLEGRIRRGLASGFQFLAASFRLLASNIRPVSYLLLTAVVIATMFWGWGFLAIYRRPLTRITASRWIYANIPAGKVIANEHWDDALPFSIDGKISFRPAGMYDGLKTSSPNSGQIENYAEDTPQKREQLYRWLNEADYIAMSSNRLWGSIPRLPMRYPMTSLYYRLMFEEKLGFRIAYHGTSFPTIFGIQFNDSVAEEAFSVYDHPEVYIFEKTPTYSEALVRSYFDAVDLEQVTAMWPKQVSAAPTALYMTEAEAARQQAGGAWSAIFDEDSLLNRSPVLATLAWWLLLTFLGVVAFPISFVVLAGLRDRGYGVSRVLGLLLLAWLSWLGPSLKVVPFSRWWIALCLALLIGVSALLAWRRRQAIADYVQSHRALLLTEEGLFLVLFLLFLLIRVGNPDLWHPARGGEKPMEFAYLNAVIRSTTFPPYDPWHAGGYLNYYYFGFVIVGALIKLTGIVPWVAYNLAVPAIFALTGLAAFSVAFNLADGDPATEFPGEEPPFQGLRIGSALAGLAATFFVAIVGNLGNVKLVVDQLAARSTAGLKGGGLLTGLVNVLSGAFAVLIGKTPFQFPNDWWFWNASRVIPDTINEFPFFTFTYADLHAHMVALPMTLLGLACAVALVRLANGRWQMADSRWQMADGESAVGPQSSATGQLPASSFQPSAFRNEPSPWRLTLPELLPILLLGLIAGALRATNTWDFPTYLLIGLLALGVLEAVRRSRMPLPEAWDERLAFLFRAAVSVLWRTVILAAVATLTFYPYTKYYATAYAGLQLWDGAKTRIGDYLIVHGFFLALAAIYLASELVAQLRDGESANRRISELANGSQGLSFAFGPSSLGYILAAMIVVLAAGLALKATVWLVALPLAVLATLLAFGRNLPPERRLGLLLIALALAITLGVEIVRQKDDIGRMNTVFKFYIQAWTLFGVAVAFGLAGWAGRAVSWRPQWRKVAWVITALLLIGVMLYPATAARAKVKDRFSAEASPHGLDGMAYMDQAKYSDNNRDLKLADDKQAILWMLRNVAGSPVILEAQTPEYRWGSRFSIYTGLPTVQGWNWHQKQQRSVVPLVVDRRVAHVKEIYDTTDLNRAKHLLETYRVSYIVVGELERAYYNAAGLAKFDALVEEGYLKLAYQGGAVRIYRVVAGAEPAAVPARPTGVGPRPVPTPTPAPTRQPSPTAVSSPLPAAQPFESPTK